MTNKDKIIELFNKYNELSVKEITNKIDVSKQMVHLILNKLVDDNFIIKQGRTPKTVYKLQQKKDKKETQQNTNYTNKQLEELQQNFLIITEVGNMLYGIDGFTHWCLQRKLPIEKTVNEFLSTLQKYNAYKTNFNVIDGTNKLVNTKGYEKIFIDKLIYCDFYAIERFGKTKLGTLLHYAKQGQNKMLMKLLLNEIKPQIDSYLNSIKVDAIAFVPPTIRREVQIMKFIETHLKSNLPVIKINKTSGIIPVPQKSLNKLEERILNAENTFAVIENKTYKHVVLIDDAVGSGSTLNQIAGKLKTKGIAQKVTGLAIVGSFKGFDVITDV